MEISEQGSITLKRSLEGQKNNSFRFRTAVQGIGDANIDFLYLNQYGGGSDGHPSAEQHTQIANDISNKLASMMNVSDPRAK